MQIRPRTHLLGMNGQAMGGRTVASTVALARAGDEAAFAQLDGTRTHTGGCRMILD